MTEIDTRADSLPDQRVSLTAQIQRNAVALISLTIALASLGYNTWRNETTESQRNVRHAAFQVIDHLEQLQSVINAMVYPEDRRVELWVDGWGQVKAAQTLGTLLPEPVPAALDQLTARWSDSVGALRDPDRAAARAADDNLTEHIDRSRQAVLLVIQELE